VYFWKILLKSPQRRDSVPEPSFASGGCGIRSQTLALLLPPTITTLSSSLLALNAFHYLSKVKQNNSSKCPAFAQLLSHFCTNFSLQVLQFLLTGGERIFLAPSYATYFTFEVTTVTKWKSWCNETGDWNEMLQLMTWL